MLSALVLCFLSALGSTFFGLGANARGIVCIEANQHEPHLPYRITPSQSMDFSGNISSNETFKRPLLQHCNRLPITVFLDDKLQLEPLQEPRPNPYIGKFFEPHAKSASSVFTHLNGTV